MHVLEVSATLSCYFVYSCTVFCILYTYVRMYTRWMNKSDHAFIRVMHACKYVMYVVYVECDVLYYACSLNVAVE